VIGIKIFVSYSHHDVAYLDDTSLMGYLRGLESEGVEFWSDKAIVTGNKWDAEIKGKIDQTDLALVLVSQAFLNSNYCTKVEISHFLKRCRDRGLVIFPIILSACEWERHEWLRSRQFLPGGNETIEEHYADPGRRKRLFLAILQDLRMQCDRIRQEKATKELTALGFSGQTLEKIRDRYLDPQLDDKELLGGLWWGPLSVELDREWNQILSEMIELSDSNAKLAVERDQIYRRRQRPGIDASELQQLERSYEQKKQESEENDSKRARLTEQLERIKRRQDFIMKLASRRRHHLS